MTQKPKPLQSIKVDGPIPAHLARSIIEETLRAAILDGRLPCGTALRQQDLADLFGVSRMPVREALRQLEAQELLSVTAHKGAVVAPLIQGDATETYELRILLETEALRQSIPAADRRPTTDAPPGISKNSKPSTITPKSAGSTACSTWRCTARRRTIAVCCVWSKTGSMKKNAFCASTLRPWAWARLSQEDHRQMLKPVEEHDVELSVKLLEQHLNRGVEVITRYLASPAAQNRKVAR